MRSGNCRLLIAARLSSPKSNCKLQIGLAYVCLLTAKCAATAAPFSFDDVEFWVGTGTNRSALVIDWVESTAEPPALAWGYRWDGVAKGRDMLSAIVAADPRLFAKLGGTPANPVALYGLGYDADDDGVFGIDDGTQFDADGFAFSGPADLAAPTDPGDLYAEGWFTGFWHYGVAAANPYNGGNWSDSGVGMATRDLADGSWDSWVFSPTFNFASFATNPHLAPAPFELGDFNRDGHVDATDYDVWRAAFGLTTQLAADANRNGVVDAADYVTWRDYAVAESAIASAALAGPVPEPISRSLIGVTLIAFVVSVRRGTLIFTNRH